MRFPRSMPKLFVAALVVFAPTATHATSHAADAVASESQDVSVSIVNNTTTPAAGKDKPAGLLNVSCGGAVHRVQKSTTLDITCTVTDDEALDVDYNDGTRTSTATIDCGNTESPDFIDGSAVTLTFTGSGASITFTQSCTGLG